jgi:hypothetical protein
MGARSVITLTTGPAGSGKTYVRCARFLVDEWLPERSGVHYSNFPVFRERVAEFVAKKLGKTADEYLDRIQIIPESVLNTWVSGQSGPWDYFKDRCLDGCHIAIDECHNFCGAKSNHKIRQRWQAWLGEIRHQGATVEFLSQSPEKVAREIHYEAGLRLSLVNSEDRRDPFLGILLGDWYELRAGFITREYETTVWEVERRAVDGKWIEQNKRVFALDPFYFEFYDSFSTPVQGGHKATGQAREFQKRTRRGLLWWFFKRNAFSIIPRCMMVGAIVYLCTGGSTWVLNTMIGTMEKVSASNSKPPAMKVLHPPSAPAVTNELIPLPTPAVGEPTRLATAPAGKSESTPKADRATVVPADTAQSAQPEKQSAPQKEAKVVRPVRLALLAKDRIALDDGQIIRIGESYGSLQLVEINLRKRECMFKGGRRVRMGDEIESK